MSSLPTITDHSVKGEQVQSPRFPDINQSSRGSQRSRVEEINEKLNSVENEGPLKNLKEMIGKALAEQYEAEKIRQLNDLTSAIPVVIVSHGMKAFVYHILFFFFGPFCVPILLCFENVNFMKNLGFLPTKANFFFIAQLPIFICNAGAVAIAINDRIDAANGDDPERQLIDLYPYFVLLTNIIVRVSIISIRHGTSSMGSWLSNSNGFIPQEIFNERIMASAWIVMSPEVCMREIEKTMAKIGSTDRFYKFKTLAPLYPTMVEKLTDEDYWTKFEWTNKKSLAQEKKKQEQMGLIMTSF